MRVIVVRDGHFYNVNGLPSSPIVNYDNFSKRYLDAFDEVTLLGRLFNKTDPLAQPVVGAGVRFVALPGFKGPVGFIKALPAIVKSIRTVITPNTAYILRLPATVPTLLGLLLLILRKPFAVEVIGDAYDNYSPAVLNHHPLSRVFQFFFVQTTKLLCRKAITAAYVTQHSLQRHFPPRSNTIPFSFTSLDLPAQAFATAPRNASSFHLKNPHLISVGMMHQAHKGFDTLIHALSLLHQQNIAARLTIIGSGSLMETYKAQAAAINLAAHITFTGQLAAGNAVWQALDTADLFVLASRQEGLPRAMIEAMARAIPCVGTAVGGTPELLEKEFLCPADSPQLLAQTIAHALSSTGNLASQSARNLVESHNYAYETIRKRRKLFYECVRTLSA